MVQTFLVWTIREYENNFCAQMNNKGNVVVNDMKNKDNR